MSYLLHLTYYLCSLRLLFTLIPYTLRIPIDQKKMKNMKCKKYEILRFLIFRRRCFVNNVNSLFVIVLQSNVLDLTPRAVCIGPEPNSRPILNLSLHRVILFSMFIMTIRKYMIIRVSRYYLIKLYEVL